MHLKRHKYLEFLLSDTETDIGVKFYEKRKKKKIEDCLKNEIIFADFSFYKIKQKSLS